MNHYNSLRMYTSLSAFYTPLFYRSFSLLLLFMSLQGCMVTQVGLKDDCPRVVNNPVTKKTSWSFAWGLVQPAKIDPQCDTEMLNHVKVKTNFGFLLLSTVTLGIVVPQRIEWCCTPPDPKIGNK